MGNALQPTQQLFVITIVEPENWKFFYSFPIGGHSNLGLQNVDLSVVYGL